MSAYARPKLDSRLKNELDEVPHELIRKRDHWFARINGQLVCVAGQGTKQSWRNVNSAIVLVRKAKRGEIANPKMTRG